jgi:hypothetical protein
MSAFPRLLGLISGLEAGSITGDPEWMRPLLFMMAMAR